MSRWIILSCFVQLDIGELYSIMCLWLNGAFMSNPLAVDTIRWVILPFPGWITIRIFPNRYVSEWNMIRLFITKWKYRRFVDMFPSNNKESLLSSPNTIQRDSLLLGKVLYLHISWIDLYLVDCYIVRWLSPIKKNTGFVTWYS